MKTLHHWIALLVLVASGELSSGFGQPPGIPQAANAQPVLISSGQAPAALPLSPLPSSQLRPTAADSTWNHSQRPTSLAQSSRQSPVSQAAAVSTESSPANGSAAIPLKPRSLSPATSTKPTGSLFATMLSVGSSLLIVLALFLGATWCYRQTNRNTMGMLPRHVVSVLGRSPLAPRQHVVLVRFGNKLVLVSQAPGELRTLSEITDPHEVDRIAGLCESSRPDSISGSFRSLLLHSGKERS